MGDYKAAENRYKNVEGTGFYRHCGKSGLMMPPLALGLWHNFGTNDDYENMKKMCFTAFDNGITHFDIANNYGPVYGSAEENFGKILREELGAYRDELIISTKAGFDMWEGPYGNWGSRKYLIASLDQSLKRLGIPYVDIFYHHRMDPNTPLEETMGALAQIVKSGKALYVGLSNYDGPTMAKAERILDKLHVPFVINQNRYSILDRSVENNGLLKQTYASGKGLICFSPLAQGMLTDRYLKDMPADSRAVKDGRFLHEDQVLETRPLLNQLNEIAAGVLVLLTLCVAGCGGVSHKSPEKVTEELIQSYTDGKEKKVKECYNQADNTEADLQAEITATLKYFAAHNPKKVSVQDCEILSENDKYSYVYITYNLILEDDQEYPCVGTYMVGKQDKTYYIMAPSQITDDMKTQAATAYVQFMKTDAYKTYTKAYETFIKKNPGYEDKISEKAGV